MGDEIEPRGTEWEWAVTSQRPLEGEPPTGGPSTDVAFDLLSRRHRRFVLYCLHSHDSGIDLPRLIECVTRLFEESPTTTPPAYDRLRARLAHTTLPRLAEADVVVYDRDADVIWPTEAIAGMGRLLELTATLDFDVEPAALENCSAQYRR